MSRFLKAYEEYFASCTAAPTEFGHAGGLMCLSSIALGRRWMERGTGIRPNLFMMLVADSSKDYKSTSVRLAQEVVKAVDKDRIGPSDFTPEALVAFMRKRRPGAGKNRNRLVLFLEEFGKQLATMSTYNQNLPATLCELYDGETYERLRAGKKPITIKDPRLSIFGAVAYGMFERYAQPNDWVTGFYARFMYITPKTRPRKYDIQPPRSKEARDRVAVLLEGIRQQLEAKPGPMGIIEGAENTYRKFLEVFQPNSQDPIVQAQRERMVAMIWKLAMLYQLDDNPDLPIGYLAIERACNFARAGWDSFLKVYKDTSGTENDRMFRRVWQLIADKGEGGYIKRDLLRNYNLRADRLLPILDILQKMEVITLEARGKQVICVAKMAPPDPFGEEDAGEG